MLHLKELAKEGMNIEQLLTESAKKYTHDYQILIGEIAKKEPSFREALSEFQKFLEKEASV